MKEGRKIPFGKIFLLAVSLLLAVKFIFDFEGFWKLFSAIGGTVISVLSYVLVGFVIAYVLDAYIQFLGNKVMKKWTKSPKAKRIVCIVIGYATFAGILAFFLFTLMPSLIDSLKMLIKEIPSLIDKSRNLYDKLLDGTLINLPESAINTIDSTIRGFFAGLLDLIDVSKISSFLTTTTVTIFNAVMGIMVSVYMLVEKGNILRAGNKILDGLFSKKTARRLKWAGRKVNEIFKCYFTGKILQACIMSIMAFIVFSLLRLPYAMLFAAVIGVFNMVPYIGPWVGAVPVVLICLVDNFWTGVAATAGIILVQIIDNWIISPRIIGNQMGISPLAILMGLCIGGKIFGVIGMIMGDVMAALIKVFFYDTYVEALRRKKIRERNLLKKQAENETVVIDADEDPDEDLFGGVPHDAVAEASAKERAALLEGSQKSKKKK